LTSTIFLA